MKEITILIFLILLGINSLGQETGSNPYILFGQKSTAKYESSLGELFYLKNSDTSSQTKAIAFDIRNHLVIYIGKNNIVLRMDTLNSNKLLRFISIDPKTKERISWTPYNFCRSNPILNKDPTGALDAPIFDREGSFLGTDDQGLRGKAIVMSKSKFHQGMKHKDALNFNLGKAGLNNSKAFNNFISNYKNLNKRPDYDGKLTLKEANEWYRNGSGKPLYVDLASIDFSTTHLSDVSNYNEDKQTGIVNLFFTQSPLSEIMGGGGNVYGSIVIKITNNLDITSPNNYFDTYNFDQKSWGWNPSRWIRNIETKVGEWKAGQGTPFNIYFYGRNQLSTPIETK